LSYSLEIVARPTRNQLSLFFAGSMTRHKPLPVPDQPCAKSAAAHLRVWFGTEMGSGESAAERTYFGPKLS
jgi:hypothetical protein